MFWLYPAFRSRIAAAIGRLIEVHTLAAAAAQGRQFREGWA
jgi:hypothetical protein